MRFDPIFPLAKYSPESNAPVENWTSLYYPGEAALGLLRLYQVDHDVKWLDGASKALHYLAKSRAGLRDVPADHWAILATSELRAVRTQQGRPLEQELVDHVAQITVSILHESPTSPASSPFHRSLRLRGMTTPTSTRVEGLLAALEVIPSDEAKLHASIRTAVSDGVAFLRRQQVKAGPNAGAMPRAVAAIATGDSEADGRFNRRVREVRIDYVQHALSAFIQFRRLRSRAPGSQVEASARRELVSQ